MGDRTAGVDPRQLARQFSRGDVVAHVSAPQFGLRVVAVWEGIGMVDVLSPAGEKRVAAEELVLAGSGASQPPPVELAGSSAVQWYTVSQGQDTSKMASKLAERFLKEGMYWAGVDRQYRRTRAEVDAGAFNCPKCKQGMRKSRYKRREKVSEALYACHSCGFLIKPCDIKGDC